MSEEKNTSVAVQLLYFISGLIGLSGLCFAYNNIAEFIVIHFLNYKSYFYLFLSTEKATYYSLFWGLVHILLFLFLCYGYLKKSRKVVIVSCIGLLLSIFISIYLYHFLTNFIEYSI